MLSNTLNTLLNLITFHFDNGIKCRILLKHSFFSFLYPVVEPTIEVHCSLSNITILNAFSDILLGKYSQ